MFTITAVKSGKRYSAALLRILLLLLTVAGLANAQQADAASESAVPYTDAKLISPWAKEAVQDAVDKGIVAGSGGQINPQGAITRAEFTKLLVAMLGIDTNVELILPFDDVRVNDWFYPFVKAGYHEQLVAGYSGTQFLPHGPITRQEMAVMLVRALHLPAQSMTGKLKDEDEIAEWARTSVQTAVATSLMQGSDDGFRPRKLATREMAFVVIMRAYAHVQGAATPSVPVVTDERSAEIKQRIGHNVRFMQQMVTNPTFGSIGGEWTILALARSGETIPPAYYDTYYSNVVSEVERLMPATGSKAEGRLDRNKGTEHARLILALTAIGKDVGNVGGYDLRHALADFNYVKTQGINGPLFALIAFDSRKGEIPIDEQVREQTTRDDLIAFILEREIEGGGWALGLNPDAPDPDITAMAIQSLTPYYEQREDVRTAIDSGLHWLSKAQDPSGGFHSWGTSNAESVAQVVVALSGLGVDADTDPRFVKNGNSAVDALLSFAAPDGGFFHIMAGDTSNGGAAPGVVDPMATDQAVYALVAYHRFLEGKNRLYDMRDVVSR